MTIITIRMFDALVVDQIFRFTVVKKITGY